jgi:hypothetical protein
MSGMNDVTPRPSVVDYALTYGLIVITVAAVIYACVYFVGWLFGAW